MTQYAFIGLGNMGGPMCANIAKAGHKVQVFDLSEAAVTAAISGGAIKAESVADAAKGADIIITMLPAGSHVEKVYTGKDGVLEHAAADSVFIDCSTIDVETARAVTSKAHEAGFLMVDAPVSGGVTAATAGTLSFMVGGTKEAFEAAKPTLEIMGKNIFHAGDAGNGQVAKIANNMLLGISMIGTSEAFALAEKNGLDAQTFFDIASTASGQCWSMTSYCPAPGPIASAPSNNEYKPGFAAAMMLKDLRLAKHAAQSVSAEIPMGQKAEALFSKMADMGHGDLDFSAIIKLIKGGFNP